MVLLGNSFLVDGHRGCCVPPVCLPAAHASCNHVEVSRVHSTARNRKDSETSATRGWTLHSGPFLAIPRRRSNTSNKGSVHPDGKGPERRGVPLSYWPDSASPAANQCRREAAYHPVEHVHKVLLQHPICRQASRKSAARLHQQQEIPGCRHRQLPARSFRKGVLPRHR